MQHFILVTQGENHIYVSHRSKHVLSQQFRHFLNKMMCGSKVNAINCAQLTFQTLKTEISYIYVVYITFEYVYVYIKAIAYVIAC